MIDCEKIRRLLGDLKTVHKKYMDKLFEAVANQDFSGMEKARKEVESALETIETLPDPYEVKFRKRLSKKFNKGSYISAFKDGIAVLNEEDAGDCFIDREGNKIITEKHFPGGVEEIKPFKKNIAAFKAADRWYLVNKEGELLIPQGFSSIENQDPISILSNGLAVVCGAMLCGLYDENGKIVHLKNDVFKQGVEKFYGYNEGYYVLGVNGQIRYVDEDGEFLKIGVAGNLIEARPFRDGHAAIKSSIDMKWHIINTSGRLMSIKHETELGITGFEDVKDFSEGVAVIKQKGRYYFIDKNGERLFKDKYPNGFTNADTFSEGVAAIAEYPDDPEYEDEYYYKFIDRNGDLLFDHSEYGVGFEFVSEFHEGFAQVQVISDSDNNKFFIDKRGRKRVLRGKFRDGVEYAEDFNEGVTLISRDSEHHCIDRHGRIVFF